MNHMCDPSEHFRKEPVPVLAKLATVWMTGEPWRRSSIFVDITHWTTTTTLHIGQVWNMSKYIQTIDTFDTTNFSSKKHTLKIYNHVLGIFFELVGKLQKLHPGWSPYINKFHKDQRVFPCVLVDGLQVRMGLWQQSHSTTVPPVNTPAATSSCSVAISPLWARAVWVPLTLCNWWRNIRLRRMWHEAESQVTARM